MKLPRLMTLFSGGGCYEYALKGRVIPVAAVEFDAEIAAHYRMVHGDHVRVDDVQNVNFAEFAGKVDILHASPPCTSASAARAGRKEQGQDKLMAQRVADAIREIKPQAFTLENVPFYQKFEAFTIIANQLDADGYHWNVVKLEAGALGSPSRRERIMVRAVKGKLPSLKPSFGPKGDWFEAIKDLPMPRSAVAQWQKRRLMHHGIDLDNLDRPFIISGGSTNKVTLPFAPAGAPAFVIKRSIKEIGGDRMVMPNGEAFTLTSRAYARLLGLGDDYPLPEDPKLAKTIVGNGMAPVMTRHVVNPLLELLQA